MSVSRPYLKYTTSVTLEKIESVQILNQGMLCFFRCWNSCSDFNVLWGMCPETASTRQLMTVPWLWSVLVSSQSSHFSQCPPSPHSQPVIIQPGPSPQPGQWSHLCKSDPSSDEPLSDPRQRIQWCEPGLVMGDGRPPASQASRSKVCSNTNIDFATAPSCQLKHWTDLPFLISIHSVCVCPVSEWAMRPDVGVVWPRSPHPLLTTIHLPFLSLLLPGLLLLAKVCQQSG